MPKSVEDAAKKPEGKPSGVEPELRTPHSLDEMLLPEGKAEPDPNASPPFTPAQIAEFKAQARKLLQQQGVSPDQIESRVDAMLTETQRVKTELDNLPPYLPQPGPPPDRPSYSDGFGDAWRRMEDSVHSLTGQNGFESFKDAWKDMGSGVVETVKDPYGTAVRGIEAEIESFRNNPEYWLGQKGFDAAATAATLPFGGEAAAARGALGDVVSPGVPHELVDAPRHVDTASPHVDHTVPAAPETPAGHDAVPVPDGPVEHLATPPVHTPEPAPVYHPPTPDVFDPNGTTSYTSGDPHYPGGWPPSTPDPTWTKGDTDPGWKHINHNFDKDWMPYQQQIGGVERTPDGALPEWVQPNPETGAPVDFDGRTHRGPQEVFLEAKDGFRGLAFAPDNAYWEGRAEKALIQVQRQIAALPPDAILEWHVSDPYGAAALRQLFLDRQIYEVDVIYTPKAP